MYYRPQGGMEPLEGERPRARRAPHIFIHGFSHMRKRVYGGSMSRTFRTRLTEPLAAQLDALCDVTQQSRSAILRACLRYVVDNPDTWPELLKRPTTPPIVDGRTPQQIENWEQNKERLMRSVDLRLLLPQNW